MKVIVVQWLKNRDQHVNEEISELAVAAGYYIANTIQFIAERPHPQLFIPKMKLDQLIDEVENNNVSKVLIDGKIRAHQIIGLEDLLGKEVIDKPQLVLEIFERKANSKEIQLQIQLAQLKYNLPKTRLQIGEGVRSERPGFMGTGEQVTEIFLSDIQSRIRKLERQLEKIKSLELSNMQVSDVPKLPIIGYYSSGKSTLFNILTDGSQDMSQEAFTTMILKSGRSQITGYPIDLIDTVGLVDLPRDILSAFDLMLQVTFVFPGIILCIDSSLSREERERQYEQVGRYFEIFTSKENPKRVIVTVTKTDLVAPDQLDQIKHEIENLDFLDNYIIINTSNQRIEDIKTKFVDAFESLFSNDLLNFSFERIHPKFISKLFNNSRIDDHGWNNDGTGHISGVGFRSIIGPIIGEIKNADG